VHHGLPPQLYRLGDGGGGYLAFLGRISPEKRPDRAIEIARRSGIALQIAAKVDRVDQGYFETTIQPMLDDPLIEFIGEIGEVEKNTFLGDAIALLFPIDWPEPFGMVLIEAMATGTPVIAYGRGSVPELIEEGLSGFIVDDLDSATAAVPRAAALDRGAIRQHFEARFSAERMARDYLTIYEGLPASQSRGLGSGVMTTRRAEAAD
jgi:glycosyltransferase involved in cell wall biosynthesis